MRITDIQLNSFRNYADQRFQPSAGVNIIIGPNAQGKSNLLEAVYLLATTKSHRTNRDADMVNVNADATRVRAEVERIEQNDVTLEINISRSEKKSVKINTVRHSKIADAIGQLNAVIFSAEDLAMIKGEPSERRRFLNLEVSQISGEYIYALAGYKRAVMQRNALLKAIKMEGAGMDTLPAWDEQLVGFGAVMMRWRVEFVKRLAALASPIHSQLTDGAEELGIEYEPSFDLGEASSAEEIEMVYRKALEDCRRQELARATTVRGPHRDDIAFHINEMDVRYFGSQGQQRTAALAVKLAEIRLVEDMVGESPVVLLDDVTAELDEKRRSHIFDLTCGRCQTFATATETGEFPVEIVSQSAIFEVLKSQVTPR